MADPIQVLAAGGAVWRRGDAGTVEVLVVHRPRYDDWSLPKGKCDDGESFLACAEREVLEETGLTCETGPELLDVTYRDHKDRPKVVRYWAMEAVDGTFTPNDEVDEVRWLPFPAAVAQLSYAHDRPVLRALVTTLTELDRLT
ncbi:MAG TPA: NUDIX hydrolase [Aquihabitans sp.]|jgi:8-oxo-dGTP diphosphatase|nr:NUDIX hydrolase [Aquihabitans sp.]